jgi:hypothetical protein
VAGKIDDPVDASFEAWPEEPGGLEKKANELALSFGGLMFPPARAWKILKDQFAGPNRFARIEYLFNAFRMGLKILESQNTSNRERLAAIEGKLETPQFLEAVSAACEEAARATNAKKIEHFAAVLVGSLTPSKWADPSEDVAVMIRDIAQLGEKDVKVLGILFSAHSSAISTYPNLIESDAFSRETPKFMQAVATSGLHADDFLSACERLMGFGLAANVLHSTTHMGPNDFCYRPTRRGLAVLSYLGGATGTGVTTNAAVAKNVKKSNEPEKKTRPPAKGNVRTLQSCLAEVRRLWPSWSRAQQRAGAKWLLHVSELEALPPKVGDAAFDARLRDFIESQMKEKKAADEDI